MCATCETHTAIYPGGTEAWSRDHPDEPFPESAPAAEEVITPPAAAPPAPESAAGEATPAETEILPASSTAAEERPA